MNNLVSIIIPCYNYGEYLVDSLASVAQQTHIAWECIIVDDGSTDNTQQIVAEYQLRDDRYKYIYQNKSSISAARNQGLRIAKGEFIQFLDADDLLMPQKLELQIQLFINKPECDIIYSGVRYFADNNTNLLAANLEMGNEDWMPKVSGQGPELVRQLVAQNIMVMNAPLTRANFLAKVGEFDTQLKVMEDWYYWLNCAIRGGYFQYDGRADAMVLVRSHASSISRNQMQMYWYESLVRRTRIDKINNENVRKENKEKIKIVSEHLAKDHASRHEYKQTLKHFYYAAKASGNYLYYMKTAFYWIRKSFIT